MISDVVAANRAEWIALLALTEADEEQRRLLESHTCFHDRTSLEKLYEEALRLAYVEGTQAKRLAAALDRLAGILGDPYSRGLSLRCTGHIHFIQNRHPLAIEAYQASRERFEAQGLELEAGRTLSSGLQALIYLGRYDQAYAWAARAGEIFERHGDHVRAARLAGNVGNILYRQDRHAEALAAYRRSYDVLRNHGQARDAAGLLSNMAVCCTSLNRFQEALAYYREAREHCIRHDLALLTVAADYNIAYLHYLRGDYLAAFELYQASRVNCKAAGDTYHEALCDLDESEIYLELNLNEEAAQAAGRAARRFEELAMWYERGKCQVNRAIALSRTGHIAGGLRLLRQARKIFGAEQNHLWPALIDLYQAILYQQRQSSGLARRSCLRAHRVLRDSLMPGKAGLCELVLAQIALEAGRPREARRTCLAALDRFGYSGGTSLRFQGRFLLGQIEERGGNLEAARQAYQLAQADVEDLRRRVAGDDLKISLLKDKLAVYEALVSLCLQTGGDPEEAFRYIQQAKSRSLADAMAVSADAGEPGLDAEEARELRRSLDSLYRQIEAEALLGSKGSPQRLQQLQSQAREQEGELARRSATRRPEPDAAELISLDEVRGVLPSGAALLEYYEVRGAVHVCVLCRGEFRIVPLGSAIRVQRLLGLLRFQISKFRLGEAYQRLFASSLERATLAHLRDLYAELIAPVRRLLRAEHLVIAPHGLLHHLPFHALHDGTRFLTDDFTISYAPSASIYALARKRAASFSGGSLVLGISDVRAPHVEAEARRAAALLPDAEVFAGAEATGELLRGRGRTSRFIHIATHGLFRRDNPAFSSLRLGDSHLSVFDLYRLSLSAELVTLSGCATGMHVVVGGDELLGLMRGVLFAGAHAALVSLWDVNDASTAEFMESFYCRMRQDGDKAAAAREAMRLTRERYPHPYFWAPFILVGEHTALGPSWS